jgi:hypothetical protein
MNLVLVLVVVLVLELRIRDTKRAAALGFPPAKFIPLSSFPKKERAGERSLHPPQLRPADSRTTGKPRRPTPANRSKKPSPAPHSGPNWTLGPTRSTCRPSTDPTIH